MEPLDLSEFEWKTVVRPLTHDDIDAVIALAEKCFPGMEPWGRDQLESQLSIFPEGQICVEIDGRLAASSSSVILEYDATLEWHNWKVISDSGYIRNHKAKGDTLYGIEIMVDPEFRGMKLSRRLYAARKELCRQKNLAQIIIGGRIPGYRQYADKMSAREYIDSVLEKIHYDPVLTAQLSNGFVVRGLTPNYLPSDSDSCGYATHAIWSNLEYVEGAKRRFHHVVEPIRICVVQYQLRTIKGFDEFAQQCEFFLDTASDYKCDFVLFPELFTTQLLSCVESSRPGQAARQLAAFTPQYLDLFTEMAVKYDINVIGGSQFVIENDLLYNIAYLFRRDGSIGKQYKIHITPSERKWWGVNPGRSVEVFETDCGPVAIQICYDIEFPELTRIATNKGAQIIFVPYNTDTRHGYLRVRYCSQARCIENQIYVAISGCTGNLPFVENSDIHYAQSGIYTPSDAEFARDAIAAECNPNVETVIIHDLDFEQLRRHRKTGSVQNWNDRQRDLYKVVYQEDGHSYDV
ncbi:bifunctional GNAT family N-acetyltransferase/carbon-nitrogen hydrolase family protein [Novipirellula artificiosorum]|uniref:N-carbamoyl-D-amino acid hydrolase n=1 Tax=Novipirellula artificiosorum TaxID=2528016 RepID=A0A5C6D8N7_9BACT|nr:bifunctional GNAT family N-acetyltransferase/carbon-nitrogen hydrolase family protein [Novipirellula artificiosorum]TWU32485.1 N-carbamoyl-D-amino acid hydrolase [Novipirellula artificiosorum]